MKTRRLGKTKFEISEIALGTWQVGGKWGSEFDHQNADTILNAAVDNGINFIDTADVYAGGESEKAVGKLVNNRSERIYIATKCGRQLNPHTSDAYTPEALRKFVEASLSNMGLETIDLIQLHCPPTAVYYRPEIFELFDRLKEEGKIQHLGVSVEKVEEALKAIEYSNVSTIQIIYNIFRQRPADRLFEIAMEKEVGIIVRVPLASGLLAGKYSKETVFGEGDHRFFNREGQAFDKGETFSGIDYDLGLSLVDQLKTVFGNPENMAPYALKWILESPAVSCIIPGASRLDQMYSNLSSMQLPDLTADQSSAISALYEREVKPIIHHLW